MDAVAVPPVVATEIASFVLTPTKMATGRLVLSPPVERLLRETFGFRDSWHPVYLPDGGLARFTIAEGQLNFESLRQFGKLSGATLTLYVGGGLLLLLDLPRREVPAAFADARDRLRERAQSEREHVVAQVLIAEKVVEADYEVWVPRADYRNVAALSILRGSALQFLDEPPMVTQDAATNRVAQLIDVVAIPRRHFTPILLFEVESTTSIQSGLIRLLEVYSRRADVRMHIVAPMRRRAKFLVEIQKAAFSELRSRVEFVSTESLSSGHVSPIPVNVT